MIYFIEAVGKNEVKIGTANRISRRLVALQSGNGSELRILRVFEGGILEERTFHELFAAHRLQGEWFDLAGVEAQIAVIGEASLSGIAPRTQVEENETTETAVNLRLPSEIVEACDRVAAEMTARNAGASVSRANALRALLGLGVKAWDAQTQKAKAS